MAVLWSFDDGENVYEVRSAGASIRLYRNGVNHSQWNPKRPLAGSVWDLLTLPALHRKRGALKDGLMLGFGAGASGRQLRELAQLENLVGVELDPVHLSIADGYFDCAEGCELIAGDAVEWVEGQERESYDYIVDDLYAEEGNIPVRCVPMDLAWFEQLTDLLKPDGILVLNIIEPEKLPYLPVLVNPKLRARLPFCLGFRLEGYENRVVAFSAERFDAFEFESNLKQIVAEFPRCRGVANRFIHLDFNDLR